MDDRRLLIEEVIDVIVMHHFLFEGICTCFGRTDHFDALGKILPYSTLQRCNYFLGHVSEFI
jgi:hypothetical protein